MIGFEEDQQEAFFFENLSHCSHTLFNQPFCLDRLNGHGDLRSKKKIKDDISEFSLANTSRCLRINPGDSRSIRHHQHVHKEESCKICCNVLTNSYEEVPENLTVADETSSLQEPVISHPLETHISFQDNNSASESYDDVDQLQNAPCSYEDIVSLPDYLEVDPSPLQKESDNGSENYDDVDQLHEDNEDYDDVG
ncbi:hypothetical protein PGIGA_G00170290 [Pangasianodon gigas]|uniref:Uncharacterized protein n=1 Tax=Pangasianodon gigas TaxID=30993 RepID=A0ACC5XTC5_PANGG|nr:hypothetical protein [Pangasianodon gigas]